jgi:hypothetical protein
MHGRIVTYAHRYKRPPRKQQAAPLAGPAVVTRRARLPRLSQPPSLLRRLPTLVLCLLRRRVGQGLILLR